MANFVLNFSHFRYHRNHRYHHSLTATRNRLWVVAPSNAGVPSNAGGRSDVDFNAAPAPELEAKWISCQKD